ncbi:pLS20_p028 family conjugation system transmembrane protein [Staphylococcus durrellii]|uniref:pLS20_p028 family conjugation system transmembrane protein n=1 Tax=Staphylococcus durrellii TaxID=2781773 RepID=UPI0018A002C5|nr:hypothetical protein [Staphylococcus durrellii]MBF7018266.1 hypothetical protein [Staphylococcus durrellii]
MTNFSFFMPLLAISDDKLLKKLKEYDDHLQIAGPFNDMIRSIDWAIMRFLVKFTDWMSDAGLQALTLFGLIDQGNVIQFLKDAQPVFMALFALTLLYLGTKMILGSRVNNFEKFTTLIIAIIFLTTLSTTTKQATDITEQASEDVVNYSVDGQGGSEDSKSGDKVGTDILKASVIDLKYMDKEKNWVKPTNNDTDGTYNTLKNSTVNYIDINETIEAGKGETELGKKMSESKISMEAGGKSKVEKLDGGFWGIGDKEYYRYSLHWFKGNLGLICAGIGYFFGGFAVASIILETIVGLFIAFFGASTLQGDKLKSTIVDILNGLVAIVFVFICMFIFKELVAFIMNKNMALYIIGMIAGCKFMIDGPKMIERKFGYDSGLSAPFRTALTTYGLIKGGTSAIKSANQTISKAGGNAASPLTDKLTKSSSNNNETATNNNEKSTNSNNSNSSKSEKSNASQKNGNAMSATNNNTNVASNNENKTSEQSYNTGQENVNTESSNGTETANGNEGYYSTSNTNDLETEKTHSEQSQTVSGGDQHSQLWGNKPEGSILSPQNVENAMNDKNGTNNYNSNGNAGGKEAVINHKTNNDTVSGGKTNAFSNSSSGGTGYNQPKNATSSNGQYSKAPQSQSTSSNGQYSKAPQSQSASSNGQYSKAPQSQPTSSNGQYSKAPQSQSASSNGQYSKTPQSSQNGANYSPRTNIPKEAKQSNVVNSSPRKSTNQPKPVPKGNSNTNKFKSTKR